jgi:hypothetical protein
VSASTASVDLLYHPVAAHGALVHTDVFGPTLRLLIAELNALPTQQQTGKTCPPAGAETAQITVFGSGSDLQFRAALGACGIVGVTYGGTPQPALQVSDALRAVIREAAAPQPPRPVPGPLEPVLRPLTHSPRAATLEADQALPLVHLPEAVQDSAVKTVPADDVESPGSPSVVERQTRWTAAMTPNDLADYEGAHPPSGFFPQSTDSGGGYSEQDFATAGNPYLFLRVAVYAQGGGAEVRVTAKVYWTPPKPPAEVIAADVTSATLSHVAPFRSNGKPGVTTRLTLHGAALARIVRAVNALPTGTVNVTSSCAPGRHGTTTLRVHNRGQLVVFASLGGCPVLNVTSGTRAEPELSDSEAFEAAVLAAVNGG